MMGRAYRKLLDMYLHNTNNKHGIDYLIDIETDQYFYKDAFL